MCGRVLSSLEGLKQRQRKQIKEKLREKNKKTRGLVNSPVVSSPGNRVLPPGQVMQHVRHRDKSP